MDVSTTGLVPRNRPSSNQRRLAAVERPSDWIDVVTLTRASCLAGEDCCCTRMVADVSDGRMTVPDSRTDQTAS